MAASIFVSCPSCPRCANETVYVETLEPSLVSGIDDCQCRCGKCGERFSISTPSDAWFVPFVLAERDAVPAVTMREPHDERVHT
jgi:hypothetical protein